uniref:Uncharacterized protein n=1 Tax=Poecilia reticulata TaxID=8081 RepID=A0A3P9NYK2_POERE
MKSLCRDTFFSHGGGSLMAGGCVDAAGPGQLTITKTKIISTLIQRLTEKNVRTSVKKLKLDWK